MIYFECMRNDEQQEILTLVIVVEEYARHTERSNHSENLKHTHTHRQRIFQHRDPFGVVMNAEIAYR